MQDKGSLTLTDHLLHISHLLICLVRVYREGEGRATLHRAQWARLLQGILPCIFFLYNAIELTQEVNSTSTKFAKTSIQIAGPKNIQHNAIVHYILV